MLSLFPVSCPEQHLKHLHTSLLDTMYHSSLWLNAPLRILVRLPQKGQATWRKDQDFLYGRAKISWSIFLLFASHRGNRQHWERFFAVSRLYILFAVCHCRFYRFLKSQNFLQCSWAKLRNRHNSSLLSAASAPSPSRPAENPYPRLSLLFCFYSLPYSILWISVPIP